MELSLITRRVPVAELKPAKYNPRIDLQPGDPAYEKIKRSLDEYGYVDPLIWNEVTGNIVGGHQRYKILVAEGATEIDCVVVHIENPQEEKALNIALNKAVGEWEDQSLASLLLDLQESGYNMGLTGFDDEEIDALLARKDVADIDDDETDLDAETIQPFVQKGDLWMLGPHRLLCGDATSSDDLDTLMDGVKANLILTDPPYNVSYESADGKSIQNDSMEDKKFHAFLYAAFKNWVPHLAEGASAYIFHADTEGLNFRTAFQEAGFAIAGVCIGRLFRRPASSSRGYVYGRRTVWCWGGRLTSGSMNLFCSGGCPTASTAGLRERIRAASGTMTSRSAPRIIRP